ncbi:hypothetical protein [Cochleicola gelatinilyticus]|uniref:Uncharacterized protein n=1 Tax=Cochleicola gelatinilyticus TaxID=1763537 RepID=A0A167H579_9FLAO|nr:hypothetical protein [Cochleicola gelatinilyticus]OAB78230.1 hypothetical protein ULVI_12190 [Cochleicola gelatinilyticus]
MILKKIIILCLAIICSVSCKYKNAGNSSDNTEVASEEQLSQSDIYIDREFYASDELNDVKVIASKETKIDSIKYSIYTDAAGGYIFSLEKFLKNDDVALYRIVDTIHLSSIAIDVVIQEKSNARVLQILENGVPLKAWNFSKKNTSEIAQKWIGTYKGKFLRMKSESADPRAWGTINLNITKDAATLRIDSYLENKEQSLLLTKQNKDQLILQDIKNPESVVTLRNSNNGVHLFTSNLLDEILSDPGEYELEKIQ